MKIIILFMIITMMCCISFIGCAHQNATSLELKEANFFKLKAQRYSNLDKWTTTNEKALKSYLKAEEITALDPKSLRIVGRLYWLKGNYDKAEEYLLKALEKNQFVENGWNNIGWVYHKKNDYPKMRDAFFKAYEYAPEKAWNKVGIAQACFGLKNFDIAEHLFKKILQDNPGYNIKKEVFFSLIKLYFIKNDYPSVIKFKKKYIDLHSLHKKQHHAYAGLGRLHYLRDEFKQAEEYLLKVSAPKYIEKFEHDIIITNSWITLGWLYLKTKQYKKMKAAFQSGFILAEKNNFESSIILAKLGLGASHFYLNEITLAEEYFNKVSKYDLSRSKQRSLNSFRILSALNQNDIGLAKKLWKEIPYLGISYNNITEGIEIGFLHSKHFGDICGLKAGDKILSINGEPLDDFGSFPIIEKSLNYGEIIEFFILRDKKTYTKKIVLDYGVSNFDPTQKKL